MQDDVVTGLLHGAVDTHIHTGPDLFPRSVTDLEAATQARESGMAAIMIKSHHTLTADRAALAGSLAEFQVFGGLTLNYFVGGFNVLTPLLDHPRKPEELARAIKEIGAERSLMATDGGQTVNPVPTRALAAFIAAMMSQGISEQEIRVMVHDNPRRILDLQ